MRRRIPILFLLAAVLAPGEFPVRDVPDLSSMVASLDGTALQRTPAALPEFSVPSGKPGETATEVGREFRLEVEKHDGATPGTANIEDKTADLLKQIEAGFEQIGLPKRNLAYAIAYAIVGNYETATQRKLTPEASRAAAHAIAARIGPRYAPVASKMTGAEKERMYETLMIGTVLLSTFSQDFEHRSRPKAAQYTRDSATLLFSRLTGISPARVLIGPGGEISGFGKTGAR